jgi:hypothetical protein
VDLVDLVDLADLVKQIIHWWRRRGEEEKTNR